MHDFSASIAKVLTWVPLLIPFGFFSSGVEAGAQSNGWAWSGGSSSVPANCTEPINCGQPGVYGTLNTPAKANMPGGRYGASSWVDNGGNFWLFGGIGLDSTGTPGGMDDFWEFDSGRGQWLWVGGSSTLPGTGTNQPVFGTEGVAAPANSPGSRVNATQWTDSEGNFWLFGNGVWNANDLWKYDPSANQWTWAAGLNFLAPGSSTGSGVYGTLGLPSSGNYPGTRSQPYSCQDMAGNVWLLGGSGIDSVGNGGLLNDLWVHDLASGTWTWMSGSDTVLPPGYTGFTAGGPNPVYGTQGVPAPGNTPGGRTRGACWVDTGGNLWLFGGEGQHLDGGSGEWNDLWEFNPVTMNWTWIAGNDAVPVHNPPATAYGNPGVYGTLGVADDGNIPGARKDMTTWTDNQGNFWLFGGTGFDVNDTYGLLNDLWEFSPITRQWTWQGGNNATGSCNSPVNFKCGNPGVYGTLGTPNAANTPGGRDSAMGWKDSAGNLWLLGGEGYDGLGQYGNLNDLWKIEPDASGLTQTENPTFSVAPGTYYSPQSITISDATAGATIYFTTDGTAPSLKSEKYSGPLSLSATAAVEAIALADGHVVSKIATAAYVFPKTFEMAASASALRLDPGSAGTLTVTVNPLNGFSSAVVFGCSGLPTGTSCSFNPTTVTPSGNPATTQLTIAATVLASNTLPLRDPALPATGLALAGGLLLLKRRHALAGWTGLFVLSGSLLIISACGGGGGEQGGGGPSHTPTTTNVAVTGVSGSILQTTTVAVTVN